MSQTSNLIKELSWRGLIQDMMPGTEEQLQKEMTSAYIGFDPTASSLHIGNLVPIILLIHLQRAGHKPFALVGGATGMIGDPSGKSAERNLLDMETLQHNVAGVRSQLEKFLNFDESLPNAAEMVNNYDWFKPITFLDFIRDVGKHITVNYMMSKDSVRKRIEGESGISFTEFTYQLIQGYDFLWLYQHKQCKLQMGGSDQWGNITTGAELIRRKTGGETFAFTCPLITKADGGNSLESEGGNVWLDPERTTPYQFYQFWLNVADADVERYIRIFSFLPQEEIQALSTAHQTDPGQRVLQKKLAEEVTRLVHGEQALQLAIETTAKLFGQKDKPLTDMSAEDLEAMDGVLTLSFPRSRLDAGVDVISFLTDTSILPSRGEARKMIMNGGMSINREKVADGAMQLEPGLLLHNRFILVSRGKKQHYLITVE